MRRAFRQQSSVPLFVSLLLSGALAAGCSVQAQEVRPVFSAIPQPPDVRLGPLFTAVQAANLYPDQKTFADAIPKSDPELILSDWQMQKMQRNFDLKRFVATNFSMPATGDVYTSPQGQSLRAHINGLWPVLTRSDKVDNQWGSLLPLPNPYVVPGGRFREVYYWDSYFTMLGLAESGRWERVQDMVDNFAYQLDTYGHIPNGNRSYYLSRSQPPFFSMMVDLLAQHGGDKIYGQYRPQLEKEYRYWMTGVDDEALRPGSATQRVVKLRDGTILNRYWDDRDVPRTESWREDTSTARQATGRDRAQLYRDLRAGAASGWDFSSRWFDKPDDLSTIRTTQILPVDLNALMFHLEKTLARAYKTENNAATSQHFEQLAERRKTAIGHYLWDEKQGWYADYDWQKSRVRPQLTAAALFPLYLQAATGERATRTASAVKKHLLAEGGLLTTTVTSGQQWDAPNGWAPLQWVAVVGLNHYGQEALAKEIGLRFLNSVQTTYEKDHKLVEKYVVKGVSLTHGGEYPLQDGFGWTNAVTLKLMDLYCPKGAICNNVNDLNNKKEP